MRQITLLRRPGSRRRPSLLLTNDFESSLSELLRRYARRWLIEKSIAEQLAFFHLNRLSSSMVIKVDFDLASPGPQSLPPARPAAASRLPALHRLHPCYRSCSAPGPT